MGSEPRSIGDRSWFDLEEEAGLLLMRSLDDAQRAKAQIYPSITKADMPDPDLQNPFDGRQVGGMGQDNRVIPYQGVPATDLSDAQRRLLLDVARSYKGWIADAHAAVSMAEIESHLDDTWFSWYGGYRRERRLLLPGAQPGDADRVRPSRRRGVRQHRSVPPSHPHARAHAERR